MNNSNVNSQLLLAKIIADSLEENKILTESEQLILDEWLDLDQENKLLYEQFKNKDNIRNKYLQYESIDLDKAKKQVFAKVRKRKTSRFRSLILKYASAAVVTFGVVYFYSINEKSKISLSNTLEISDEVITLQLENGDIEIINQEGEQVVRDNKGSIVGTQKGTNLVYKKELTTEELVYSTVNVPYGKKLQVELSDGTIVHVNAGSSLKYPVQFNQDQNRQVFVKGEAYFEVTEDKDHPFVVTMNNRNIRVLGTKFNVSSFDDDENISTVLVEGSVRLYSAAENYSLANSTALKVGYLACWNKSDQQMSLEEVDTRIYTAWINGKMIFKNTSFKSIRKKLERKYNVEIINNNKILDENLYNASFDVETIEQVLNTFSENFAIDYTIANNQIIIN
jgi:ferric-dicitrate binding protein FerR (iron transport regulator)